jgi:hypothetical protein
MLILLEQIPSPSPEVKRKKKMTLDEVRSLWLRVNGEELLPTEGPNELCFESWNIRGFLPLSEVINAKRGFWIGCRAKGLGL